MNRLSRSRAYQRWTALSRRFIAPLAVLLVSIGLSVCGVGVGVGVDQGGLLST
jgi:hypothetical protein